MVYAFGVILALPALFLFIAAAVTVFADAIHRREPDAPAGWRRRQALRQWRVETAKQMLRTGEPYTESGPINPSPEQWAAYEAARSATSISKRAGRVVNWTCTGMAVPVYLGGLALYFLSARQEGRVLAVIIIVAGAGIWGIGRAARYILANEY